MTGFHSGGWNPLNDNAESTAAVRAFLTDNMREFQRLSNIDPEHASDRAMQGHPDWTESERKTWDGFIAVINDRPRWDRLPDYWQEFITDIIAEFGLTPPKPDGLHRTKGTRQ